MRGPSSRPFPLSAPCCLELHVLPSRAVHTTKNCNEDDIDNSPAVVILGGWLLVANMIFSVSVSNSSFNWTSGSTYRDIGNYRSNEMGISKGSMKKLRTHLSFKQIRFHCRKQQGRTFHVITAANSTGEAVVQYFTGQTNTLPASCGSFQRMDDDNSQLSVTCDRWGYDGAYYVGKWGHHMKQGRDRMYNHAASVPFEYSWAIVKGLWFCDDDGNNTLTKNSGDFWRIYVR